MQIFRLGICLFLYIALPGFSWAQLGGILSGGGFGAFSNLGNNFSNFGSGGKDSLVERDFEAEQVRLSYHRLFDRKFFPIDDSSFNPRREEFFIPYGKNPLGNYGNAIYDYVFDLDKRYTAGANFHVSPYDFYRLDKNHIRIYDAIRPFGSLGYLIGSMQQQILSGSYTQNLTNNLNIFFDYQFSNSPGYFKNQTANNSKLSLGFQYRAYGQRYLLTAFIVRNNMVSNENNGVVDDDFVKNTDQEAFLSDRSTIPVRLGDNIGYTNNPFDLVLHKGRREKDFLVYVENSYRFGVVDSLWSRDSVRVFVFNPKITASHLLEYETVEHSFLDNTPSADQEYYQKYLPSIPLDKLQQNLRITDKWSIVRNKLQLRYFPKRGVNDLYWQTQLGNELMRGNWLFNSDSSSKLLFNLYLSGEFQALTKKDSLRFRLSGIYYFAGANINDVKIGVSVQKKMQRKWGNLSGELSFLRTRPLDFNWQYSAFNYYSMDRFANQGKFNPLQIWNATVSWELLRRNLSFRLRWTRMKNYIYQINYDQKLQYQPFLDIPQIELSYLHSFSHGFFLFNRLTLQPSVFNFSFTRIKSFSPPLELPLFHTQHKFYFEHNFLGYLRFVVGMELRWNSPYYSPGYNPVYAMLVQQKTKILYNFPQIHLFMKTRIRNKFSFTARVENLNSLRIAAGTLSPTNNNFVLPNYPLYAMIVQGGIVWDFVN